MATHDYVIDNQTAPNFRADLNNALQAIVSNNSNATAPTVTYANMTWYDTATNILYMRNEDNDAWIALGTLDQTADTFSASVALASQAEAEAGTDNTKVMTPLRVAQAVTSQRPIQSAVSNVSGSRSLGVTYTNSNSTRTLYVSAFLTHLQASTTSTGVIGGLQVSGHGMGQSGTTTHILLVPPSTTYSVSMSGSGFISRWSESLL